jgi:type IV pilus assembly protein PilC
VPATFAYKVRDREGRLVEGSLEADSPDLVVNKLRSMGYVPVAIERADGSALKKDIKLPFGGKVKQKDVAVFSRQFATMINAGLSLIRALHILEEQTENEKLRETARAVRTDVERGSSLAQSLGRHPKVFTRLYVAMVKAGEAGGVLDSVLLNLASTIEKQVELKRKIKSAMTYPVAVFGLVCMIVSAMLLFVVPMFEKLYSELGGVLPLPTRMLLAVSGFVTKFFPFILVAAGIGLWLLRRWIATDKGRAVWDAFKLKLPVFGKLIHKTAITRFCRTLSVLLRSGVPVLESLEITSETVDNAVVSRAVKATQEAVKGGESIAAPLNTYPVFPTMVVQMLSVGEETGAVDDMLDRVADFYDQEIEATVDALTSLLEPMLIVVMGATVGGMVVALYMPMFNIINLIQ